MDLGQYAAMMQARDPTVFDEPVVPDNPDHVLDMVSEFTHYTAGWERQPSGGEVPIRKPLDQPHWRWYCVCGAVSGRLPDEETARTAHQRHVKANSDG